MSTMQNSISVAANSVSANVLAGLQDEFIGRRPAKIAVSATGSAIGLNCSFLVQGRQAILDQAIGLQNRFPILPDDFLVAAGARPGERLFLTFRNTTVGALTAFWKVDIKPV